MLRSEMVHPSMSATASTLGSTLSRWLAVVALIASAPLCRADGSAPFPGPGSAPGTGVVRVGEEMRLHIEVPEVRPEIVAGRPADEPVLVWSEELTVLGASYIAPHFSRFNLPLGSYLVIRATDDSRAWRYSGRGKPVTRGEGFWGVHIAGETAILELFSNRPIAAGAVALDRLAHGYPDYAPTFSDGPEAICGTDDSNWAQCYQSSEPTIYNRARAVARLLINGVGGCTGWLVGDEGHVMTNAHCIDSSSDALNTDYEFMAERSCSTNCASSFACPGTVVATSATLVKLSTSLDYTLVKLPNNPSGTYGFLQMRPSGAVVDERIYIPQHPRSWGKRIAVDSTDSSDASGKCEVFTRNQTPCFGGPGDVGYFCDTQPGSSGSPVLGYSDHRVVALHHCGSCPNTGVRGEAVISDLGASLPRNGTPGSAPEIRVTLASDGTLVPDGGAYDFGTWNVSDLPTSRLFNICNDGNVNLAIDNPATLVSGTGFTQIGTAPATPVAPGTCTNFRVRFYVNNPGTYTGAVTIQNNDSNEDPYNIALSGTAVGPEPEIRVTLASDGTVVPDGGTYDFGTWSVSSLPTSRLFNICNDGNANLVLDNPTTLVSGTGFTQIGTAPVTPVTAGTCTNFRVRFHVNNPDTYTGAVTIQNNDSDEDPYDIILRGTAN